MQYKMILALPLFMFSVKTFSQTHTDGENALAKMQAQVKEYKLDTTAPPDDQITRKIIELRQAKGGFNINQVVLYKLLEEKQKGKSNSDHIEQLYTFFNTGNGQKWLNNAVIRIYRAHFTLEELNQIAEFYKTSAGRKMAETYPLVIMQSATAASLITEIYEKANPEKK